MIQESIFPGTLEVGPLEFSLFFYFRKRVLGSPLLGELDCKYLIFREYWLWVLKNLINWEFGFGIFDFKKLNLL